MFSLPMPLHSMLRYRHTCLLGLLLLTAGACGGNAQAPQANVPSSDEPEAGPQSEGPDCGTFEGCVQQCEAGNPDSCEWVGHMHETGDGAPQDYALAAKYYDQACSAGKDDACAHLAMMYDIGLAVEEDSERAAELYRRACTAGNSWACNRENELQ